MWSSLIKIAVMNLRKNLESKMTQQYLMPKARNTLTGQTVMEMDLTGTRLELRQRSLAETLSKQLADKMIRQTTHPWQGFVDVYKA